jgi:hypothetical protein
MGFEYIKRPLRVVGSTSQIPAVDITGDVTLSGDLRIPVESKTGTAADQSLSDHGVSFITVATSNLANDFVLPNPPAAGAVKYVFVNFATTSGDEFALHCGGTVAGSSTVTFFGTTCNTITGNAIAAGGGDGVGGSPGLMFIGVSTAQWAVGMLGSTVLFNFVGSTGSTSQN